QRRSWIPVSVPGPAALVEVRNDAARRLTKGKRGFPDDAPTVPPVPVPAGQPVQRGQTCGIAGPVRQPRPDRARASPRPPVAHCPSRKYYCLQIVENRSESYLL